MTIEPPFYTPEVRAVLAAAMEWKYGPVPDGDAMLDVQLARVRRLDEALDAYRATLDDDDE